MCIRIRILKGKLIVVNTSVAKVVRWMSLSNRVIPRPERPAQGHCRTCILNVCISVPVAVRSMTFISIRRARIGVGSCLIISPFSFPVRPVPYLHLA